MMHARQMALIDEAARNRGWSASYDRDDETKVSFRCACGHNWSAEADEAPYMSSECPFCAVQQRSWTPDRPSAPAARRKSQTTLGKPTAIIRADSRPPKTSSSPRVSPQPVLGKTTTYVPPKDVIAVRRLPAPSQHDVGNVVFGTPKGTFATEEEAAAAFGCSIFTVRKRIGKGIGAWKRERVGGAWEPGDGVFLLLGMTRFGERWVRANFLDYLGCNSATVVYDGEIFTCPLDRLKRIK